MPSRPVLSASRPASPKVSATGHTPGHIGVVVQEDDCSVLLAGDSSYTQQLMLAGAVDGVAPDEQSYRRTTARIHEFAQTTPIVYLVAHDPDTGIRIEQRQIVEVKAAQPAA